MGRARARRKTQARWNCAYSRSTCRLLDTASPVHMWGIPTSRIVAKKRKQSASSRPRGLHWLQCGPWQKAPERFDSWHTVTEPCRPSQSHFSLGLTGQGEVLSSGALTPVHDGKWGTLWLVPLVPSCTSGALTPVFSRKWGTLWLSPWSRHALQGLTPL